MDLLPYRRDCLGMNKKKESVPVKLLRPLSTGLHRAWIIVLVVVIGLAGHVAVHRTVVTDVQAEITSEARATAAFLAATFERTANAVEALMDDTILRLAAAADPADAQGYLESRGLPSSIVQLTLVGADGWTVASSQGAVTPVDLNDREHIRVHVDGMLDYDRMFISVPVLGRISGQWTIQFTKAFRDPQGALDGVLVASYAVSDFLDLYSTFPMDEGSLIALTGLDGVIRARSVTGDDDTFGVEVPLKSLHEQIIRKGTQGVAFVSPIDGVARVGWAQVLERHRLYLLVATPLVPRMGVVWVYEVAWWLFLTGMVLAGYAIRQYYIAAMLRERLATGQKAVAMANLTSLGEITAGLSHEIGTPITTIMLAIGNLKRKIETGTVAQPYLLAKLDRIEASAARIGTLMETARGIARRPGETDSCDPAAATRNALVLVGQQLELAGIELVSRIEPCDAVPLASSSLETVIINLLTNARDAILAHHPVSRRVTIACFADRGSACIVVEDTGGGVPKAIRSKIFEPFFTTKEAGKGTGIGLSSALEIIRGASGEIAVENVGDGARFTLRIPYAEQAS